MTRFSLSLVAAVALLVGCAPPDLGSVEENEARVTEKQADTPSNPNCTGVSTFSLTVTAPVGLGPQHLGRPLGSKFETIAGADGASLFPSGEVKKTTLNVIEHKFMSVDNSRAFNASVSGWGVVSVSAGTANTHRYASYRASQLEEAHEIDDATAMRKAPPGAAYYVARIIYGHSFEMVFSGDSRKFNAGVKAKLFGFGGSASAFAAENKLSATAVGRGLQPVDGDAIFASSGEEIQAKYKATGPAVPILVEYRTIPTSCAPEPENVEWLKPQKYRLSYDKVQIYKDADGQWSLDAACKINDQNLDLDNKIVWDRQGGIGESCTQGMPGPQNDQSFCPLNIFWTADIEALDGDTIKCGVSGTAWGNKKPIPYAEFTHTTTPNATKTEGKFGNGNGSTEYWMFYSLTPIAGSDPPVVR